MGAKIKNYHNARILDKIAEHIINQIVVLIISANSCFHRIDSRMQPMITACAQS